VSPKSQNVRRDKTSVVESLWGDERAAQILEFALSLPLLMVFVVGIFDFSGALSLKQKLTNAAREAARVAAADPANDLNNATPVSVSDAFQVVVNYLKSENVNDCGLSRNMTPTSSGLVWTSAALTGCPGRTGLTLTVNRGCITTQTINGTTTDIVNTCVTIQYPYSWRFSSVIKVLVPTASYAKVIQITTVATAFNEN
jgi:Flp pilus assembly protein TadG